MDPLTLLLVGGLAFVAVKNASARPASAPQKSTGQALGEAALKALPALVGSTRGQGAGGGYYEDPYDHDNGASYQLDPADTGAVYGYEDEFPS